MLLNLPLSPPKGYDLTCTIGDTEVSVFWTVGSNPPVDVGKVPVYDKIDLIGVLYDRKSIISSVVLIKLLPTMSTLYVELS